MKERQAFEAKGVYGTLLGDHFRVSIGESIGSKVKDMRKNMRGVTCREMKKWKVLEAMMYAKLSPPPDSRTSSQKRKSADSFRKDKVQDLVAKAKLDKKGGKLEDNHPEKVVPPHRCQHVRRFATLVETDGKVARVVRGRSTSVKNTRSFVGKSRVGGFFFIFLIYLFLFIYLFFFILFFFIIFFFF